MELRRRQRSRENPVGLWEWTTKHRKLLVAGRPFIAYPYIREIYEDDSSELVIYKGAQLGASEYLVSWILWAADIHNATGLYVFPTDVHVSAFSAARFGPAIEREVSPYLANLLVSSGAREDGKRGVDQVGLRRVRDRFIYFRGGAVRPDGTAPQLHSINGDALVVDELDQTDPRALPIARKRLLASEFRKVRMASTPTYPDVGIHREYANTDQRRWFIRCLQCSRPHAPSLEDLILESDGLDRPTAWNKLPDGTPFLKCPSCGGVLDRNSGIGEWVATYPTREVHGYHLFRLSLPGMSLPDIIDGLQETDETKRQQFINQDLGLPFTPSSAESMTDIVLDACRRNYALGVPSKPTEEMYAGIDVNRLLNITIRSKGPDGSFPLRFAGEVTSFEEAERILRQYNVRLAVMDALPETRKARELQAEFPRLKVWLAFYAGAEGAVTKKNMVGDWDAKRGTVNIDRTRALDAMFAGFHNAAQSREGEAVKNFLPANARDLRDYYAHLKAPKRVVKENSKGEQLAMYIESGPDHFAHAENYCRVALECPYAANWVRGAG